MDVSHIYSPYAETHHSYYMLKVNKVIMISTSFICIISVFTDVLRARASINSVARSLSLGLPPQRNVADAQKSQKHRAVAAKNLNLFYFFCLTFMRCARCRAKNECTIIIIIILYNLIKMNAIHIQVDRAKPSQAKLQDDSAL